MKAIFKANDGSEHKTAAAAERHDKLLAAGQKLNEAARAYERAIAGTVQTADGQPFDFERRGDYWCVRDAWGQPPSVFEIHIYPHNTNVDFDGHEARPVVRFYQNSQYVTFPINELYSTKAAAELARDKLTEKRLQEAIDQINEMQKKRAKP